MPQTTTPELRIRNTSQELFREAIETFPVTPGYFEISVLSKGVPRTLVGNEAEKNYVEECIEKRVVPHSEIKYEFDGDSGLFEPRDIRVWTPKCDFNARDLQRVRVSGQPHLKRFNQGSCYGLYSGRAFEAFKELVPFFVSQGDEIGGGELITSTYHLTGYNQGDYFDTGLHFGNPDLFGYRRGLELKVDSSRGELAPDDRDKLISWFKQLRDKYDRKQTKIF